MKRTMQLINLARSPGQCRLVPCLLVTSLLLLMPGCGEKRVPVFKVEGQVTFNGEPPVGAQVVFHPDGHKLPDGDVAIGTVKVGTEGTSQPYSFHTGSVNVLLGDGSARSLSEDLDITIAAALVTRNDGGKEATVGADF